MCRMVSDVRNSPGNEAGIGDGDDDDDGRGRCWRCCCCCYCSNCVEDLRRLQDQHECVGQFLGLPAGAPLSSWSWPRPLHSSLLQSPTVSLALSLVSVCPLVASHSCPNWESVLELRITRFKLTARRLAGAGTPKEWKAAEDGKKNKNAFSKERNGIEQCCNR
uniref:(northern house mosquito) hypothetical protein n=1 Tax=Culex pipiens TaxID=7175 RepID=A0A8D8FSQ7_CULPI